MTDIKFKTIYKQLNQAYYIVNFSIVISFIVLRCLGIVERSSSERLAIYYMTFAIFIKIMKARVTKSLDFILTSALFIVKLSILYLLYCVSNYYLIAIYVAAYSISYIFYSQPIYQVSANTKIQYFNPITLTDSISNHINNSNQQNESAASSSSENGSSKYLMITFFALWSPVCTYLSPTFSELAEKYGDKIKFGKVDIGRWKNLTMKYNIDDSIKSKQIPTIILFKDGIEIKRLPTIDNSTAFTLKENEIIDYFNLNEIKNNSTTTTTKTKSINNGNNKLKQKIKKEQ